MSQHPYTGLEHDLRPVDDELPTAYDNRDYAKYLNGEHPQHSNGENKIHAPLAPQSSPGSKQICGIRRTTFWLIVALAIILSLGVIGTGVAGSLAVKRGRNTTQTSSSQPDSSSTPINPVSTNVSSCPTPSETSTSTPTATTECDSLPQPPKAYTSRLTQHQFDISCTTDFPGGDMVGVFVFNFADCIEACSSYNFFNARDRGVPGRELNSSCLGVSYDVTFPEKDGLGNCFLKWTLGDGAVGKNDTSSAVVVRA